MEHKPDAEAFLHALEGDRSRWARSRRLEYRCDLGTGRKKHRCLLLEIVDVGEDIGVLVRMPRYKYSEAQNEQRSNAAGRANNTLDGDRKWKGAVAWLENTTLDSRDIGHGFVLGRSCDHVLDFKLTPEMVAADLAAGAREVRVRADGSRYSV